MGYTFPLLSASDIECRIGTVKEGSGVSLLLYKDARVDMRMLDEFVGWNNWQREHKELKGNLYCGVSIWDDEKKQWITKWDCGKESNTEAEKGEASDSFKRACVNATGVGRELYTAPFIWISDSTVTKESSKLLRFYVEEIGYDSEKNINKLVIRNEKTKQVAYTFGTKEYKSSVDTSKNFSTGEELAFPNENREKLLKLLNSLGDKKERWEHWILVHYGIKGIGELPDKELERVIEIITLNKDK